MDKVLFGVEYETILICNPDKFPEAKNSTGPIVKITDPKSRRTISSYITETVGDEKQFILIPVDDLPQNNAALKKPWIFDEDRSVSYNKIPVQILKLFRNFGFPGFDQPQDPSDANPIYTKLNEQIDVAKVHDNKSIIFEQVEIISPPLKFENRYIIERFCNVLSPKSDVISIHNHTTSTHIHLTLGEKLNSDHVFNIFMAWWYFEPILMTFFPSWRRENMYCQPIRQLIVSKLCPNWVNDRTNAKDVVNKIFVHTYDQIKNCILAIAVDPSPSTTAVLLEDDKIKRILSFFQYSFENGSTRYATLNLLNLIASKNRDTPLGTIEVRLKHGSCDSDEIMNYISLYARFFIAAITNVNFFESALTPPDYKYKHILCDNRFEKSEGLPNALNEIEKAALAKIHFNLLKSFLGDAFDKSNYFEEKMNMYLAGKDFVKTSEGGKKRMSRNTKR